MDLPVSKPWKPWTTSRGQVGGYRVEYGSRFAFQSVRGAGHMVPYTQVSTCGCCAGTGRGLTKKIAPPRRGDVRRVPRRGRRGNVNVNGGTNLLWCSLRPGWRPGHGGGLSGCAIDGGGTIFRRYLGSHSAPRPPPPPPWRPPRRRTFPYKKSWLSMRFCSGCSGGGLEGE